MDVVDVLGHLARGLAEPHPLDERLDEGGGLRPHDVRADDEPRASVEEHLREGRLIDERPPVGGAAEVAATDDVIDALGAGLLLGAGNALVRRPSPATTGSAGENSA